MPVNTEGPCDAIMEAEPLRALKSDCNAKPYPVDAQIVDVKQHRVDLDAVLQRIKAGPRSRERALVITKVQEAVMWLGMELKELGAQNPYPNSYNPGNTIVDKTADGLKL